MDEVIAGWAAHASIVLLHAVQIEAPKGETGLFAASMVPNVSVLDGNVTIRIIADTNKPKALWLRNGTMAHEIGTAGEFLWNPNGTNEFAATGPIVHPGMARNQFGLRAIQMVRTQLLLSLADEVMTAMTAAVAELRK
jgi:hypothetical protein